MSHNTFGHLFRVTTFGESHGPMLGCVVDGCPPGLDLSEADIQPYLDQRKPGQSRYTTQRKELDQVKIVSGVFEGVTTGTPIGLIIENNDQRSKDYSVIKDKFRPGHADFTYMAKYGLRDYRGGGRSSARETAMRVAAGGVARKVLGTGIEIRGALVRMGEKSINPSNWDWDEFVTRNNSSLIANWGNLANRVLSFAHKHWEGIIPTPGELGPEEKEILAKVEKGFDQVGDLLDQVKLRAALKEALVVSSEVNKYLEDSAPWGKVKTDKEAAATIIYTAMQCIDHLKIIFAPFVPFSSEKLHQYLGYTDTLFGEQFTETLKDGLGEHTALRYRSTETGGDWSPGTLEPGKAFQKPSPLFTKYDPEIAESERERMK